MRWVLTLAGWRLRRRRLFNVWVVFTFVALWHDMTLKLLTWGWLLAVFFIPETLASRWASSRPGFVDKWYYRHVVSCGAVANIGMMIIANLVGFGVGTGGTRALLDQVRGVCRGVVVGCLQRSCDQCDAVCGCVVVRLWSGTVHEWRHRGDVDSHCSDIVLRSTADVARKTLGAAPKCVLISWVRCRPSNHHMIPNFTLARASGWRPKSLFRRLGCIAA